MTNGKVGFGEGTIKSTGQLLADAKVELKRLSAQLQNEISALQGKWGGQGAQAFSILNQAWDEKQGAIVMKLEQFEATLDETEKSMTTTDEQSSSSVAAIASQMGG
jgi:WXG100 family type VII secretion target